MSRKKIQIPLPKQVEVHVFLVLVMAAVAFGALLGSTFATSHNIPNPGHGAAGIGPGTFTGSASDVWSFPGKVGIGMEPTKKLDVAGHIKGTALCIGNDCRSSWPSPGITNLCYCIQLFCFGGDGLGSERCAQLGSWTSWATCGGEDENVRIKIYAC